MDRVVISRVEAHFEHSLHHHSVMYTVDVHTWELPASVGLLRVTKDSESITHSLSLAKVSQLLQELKPAPS